MIKCPKCGFEQDEGTECARCGVIFAKLVRIPEDYHTLGGSAVVSTYGRTSDERGKWFILLALVLILGFLSFRSWKNRELKYLPGVLISSEPQQILIRNPVPWKKGRRLIFPLARFSLKARVLSKENYSLDAGADISPIDLALGWGPMSDQKVLDQLEIAQGDRFYVMAPIGEKPPLPINLLLASSSNMHILPANAEIEKALNSLRIGELVDLTGYLVGIKENGQWIWVSSLTRYDTGNGACEVFWVQSVTTFTSSKRL